MVLRLYFLYLSSGSVHEVITYPYFSTVVILWQKKNSRKYMKAKSLFSFLPKKNIELLIRKSSNPMDNKGVTPSIIKYKIQVLRKWPFKSGLAMSRHLNI